MAWHPPRILVLGSGWKLRWAVFLIRLCNQIHGWHLRSCGRLASIPHAMASCLSQCNISIEKWELGVLPLCISSFCFNTSLYLLRTRQPNWRDQKSSFLSTREPGWQLGPKSRHTDWGNEVSWLPSSLLSPQPILPFWGPSMPTLTLASLTPPTLWTGEG